MKLFKAGDKFKAICPDCAEAVPATCAYRDMSFDDEPGVVKDLLVAVCDQCDTPVAVPAQATPTIKRARARGAVSLSVQVPVSDIEILNVAADRIDTDACPGFRNALLAYYMKQCLDAPNRAARLCGSVPDRAAGCGRNVVIPSRRLCLRISPAMDEGMKNLMAATGIGKSQFVRGLVRRIELDIVAPEKPKGLARLKDLAAVSIA